MVGDRGLEPLIQLNVAGSKPAAYTNSANPPKILAAPPGFEPGKCQSQSLMPCRLATGQYGGADGDRTRVHK